MVLETRRMGVGTLVCQTLCLCALGCQKPAGDFVPIPAPDYSRPLPPGELALRKITDPSRIPDFADAFRFTRGLDETISRSLNYLSKPSSRKFFPYGPITHQNAVDSLKAFREVLASASDGEDLNRMIRERFDVWESVGWNGEGTLLYTGYYQPIFDGRWQSDARFRYPLYKTPPDLVKDELGRTLGRRDASGAVVPYYTRKEIDALGVLKGNELAWLKDRFETYIVTVQGCAKLRMEDGDYAEIGYDANNGHDYVSAGVKLVEDGKIPADQLSVRSMIELFDSQPELVDYYILQNPRYIFFRRTGGGPIGCLNEHITPYRTIATDKDIYPRACLAFVDTQLPSREPEGIIMKRYRAFALDQDTGGAIRAAGRCDVFMGTGNEMGELAGRTYSEGRLFYLFLRQ